MTVHHMFLTGDSSQLVATISMTVILHVEHKVDSVALIKERKGYVNYTL